MSEDDPDSSASEACEPQPASAMLPVVYRELRKLAASWMARETPGQTLSATALVHEAYLRIIGHSEGKPFAGRAHFFSAAATAMRRVLIEQARRKRRLIHGGGWKRIELGPDLLGTDKETEDLIALDAALEKFARVDPLKARLVELRHFAGLTGDQAAEALGISPSTADRYWTYARAWLHRELAGGPPNPEKGGTA